MTALYPHSISVEDIYPLQLMPDKLEYIHECIVDAALAGSIGDNASLNTALSLVLTFRYDGEVIPMQVDDNVPGLHVGYTEDEKMISHHYIFIRFSYEDKMYMMLLPTKEFTREIAPYCEYRESPTDPWIYYYPVHTIGEDGVIRQPVLPRMICEYYQR